MPSASLADVIADKYTLHSVQLLRFEAGERARIRKILATLQGELERKLTGDLTDVSSKRLQAVYKAADRTIQDSYSRIAKTHDGTLIKFAEIESAATVNLINSAIGVSLLNAGVSKETWKSMLNDDIVLGRPAKAHWAQQANNLRGRFRNEIRKGIFAGETLSDLTRRIRGRRENNFQDGIMTATTRDAESLIRTSVQSVANAARYETYQENDDVIKGQQWFSTLDNRTTEQCMALSGQAWTLDGEMLEGTVLDFPGYPPIHFQCRSTLIALVKSWGDLLRDAKGNKDLAKRLDKLEDKIGPGTQASMDGQIAGDLRYEEWLESKSETFQREVLGDGKWELWNDGDISFTDLVDQSGRPLTLDELENLVADR